MSWSSAGAIFDQVATALVEGGVSDEVKTTVCGTLIGAFLADDWETADLSLKAFCEDPAIVAAFREHEIVMVCGARGPAGESCEREQRHESAGEPEHADERLRWTEATKALAADVAAALRAVGCREAAGRSVGYVTRPGFEITAAAGIETVQVVHREPVPRGEIPRDVLERGEELAYLAAEGRERPARAAAACAGYGGLLERAGWSVQDRTDHALPHLVVARCVTVG